MLHRRRRRFMKTENQLRICPREHRIVNKSVSILCMRGRCLPVSVITGRNGKDCC